MLALIPLALPIALLRGRREGLFRGTTARSLIPVFACVVILVGLTTQPYLAYREQFLVQNDPLLSYVERGAGFSKPETQLVERLQREVLSAFASLDNKP